MTVERYTSTLAVPREHEELIERPQSVDVRVLSGQERGRVHTLGGPRPFTIGRGAGNDVRLPDPSVSIAHASLALCATGVELRDKGSRNGTRIGRAYIHHATLVGDAEFLVGDIRLQLGAVKRAKVAATITDSFCGIRGRSPVMRELFAKLDRLGPTPLSTILYGETGTGKELFARALHARSGRRGRFVVLDCAALPPELAESVILGHKKGAFTGATEDHSGVFEDADGGTLLLDELGELPLALQPKLLRVLQQREVQRIGETQPRPVDVRVVAATHRDLSEMISDNLFRLDLHQRLAQVELLIPPLRERIEDVGLLAQHFLAQARDTVHSPLTLAPAAIAALSRQRWRGNVRALKNVIERAAYLSTTPKISTDALGLREPPPSVSHPFPIDELLTLQLKEASDRVREAFQREYCVRLLSITNNNLAETARRAGYSKNGMKEILRRLELWS